MYLSRGRNIPYFLSAGSLVLLYLLPSCNFEKRLYRNGYYVSKPHAVRPVSAGSTQENSKKAAQSEAETVKEQPETASASLNQEPILTQQNPDELPIIIPTKKREDLYQPARSNSVAGDEEKTPKEVKYLVGGSLGAFLLALLYGFFLWIGSVAGAQIIFILIPFSIVGLSIYALMLRGKYSTEDGSDSKKKPKKRRGYSQRTAFLLSGLLGIFGAHRFYLGYPKIGLFQMFTLGGFFIWFFIDMIRIKIGKLKPFEGVYQKGDDTYSRGKKKAGVNKPMRLVKIAFLISLLALIAFLCFAMFL